MNPLTGPGAPARALLFLSLILAVYGCSAGSADDPEPIAFSTDTVNGIVQLHTGRQPAAWQAEPLLRIGTLEGGPAEFGSVRSVVADADGNLYVADGLAREIRVFAPDGAHLRTFGRQGAGPGEFANLVSLAWAGELLAANDPGNARIQLFTPDGEPAGTWSGTATTGAPQLLRLRRSSDEEFYALDLRRTPERLESVWVRHTAAGAHDTLAAPAPPSDEPRGMLCHRADGGLTSIRFPSRPELVYGFAPGSRVASSWTDSYRIAMLEASGDTAFVLTWARDPVQVDDEVWEKELEPLRELHENYPGTRCEPSEPARPAHRSTLREMVHDDAGRMWVESATHDGFAWDVFSADGEWIGVVRLPERDPRASPYVRNDVFYQVERDDLDVQSVAAYRIRSAGAAPRS